MSQPRIPQENSPQIGPKMKIMNSCKRTNLREKREGEEEELGDQSNQPQGPNP
jgi:hypothetical protein